MRASCPPIDPDIAAAEALLDEFAGFWEIEHDPAERRRLLGQLFDRIWQDGGAIVAVRPPRAVRTLLRHRRGHPSDRRDPGNITEKPEVQKAGATGVKPMSGTATSTAA